MSDQIHQIVTERMIAALQQGTVPWRKPWHTATGQPRSMTTGAPYRGANIFLLGLSADQDGYTSPWWGTYRQIATLGGQVRKGMRSTLVVFWKQLQVTGPDPHTGEPAARRIPMLRYYRVFNAGQADGLPGRFHPEPGQDIQLSAPQDILDRYIAAGGPQLRHAARDRASYHPATDMIRLPLRSQFRSAGHLYATAFHEAAHSTGHPDRLSRPGIAAFDHFGSGRYAREELVAEMSSAMLCARAGIDNSALFANSASYVANWLTTLHNDARLVITAAGHAQRACDLITEPEREPLPVIGHAPAGEPAEDVPHSSGEAATALSTQPEPDPVLGGRPPAALARLRDAQRELPAPGSPHPEIARHARPARAASRAADPQADAG